MSTRSPFYRSGSVPETNGDPSVELRRYLEALRRSLWLILLIMLVMGGTVLALSLRIPSTYEANARIVYHDTSVMTDSGKIRRLLLTTQRLLLTREVIEEARRVVPQAAQDPPSVSTSVDEEADLINVTASGRDPEVAADYANAVADVFLRARTESERRRLARARAELERELQRIGAGPAGDTQVAVLRERLSQLAINDAAVGADLEIAEAARPASSPSSPRPIRNTILALFAALFLGVLIALARDQLVPRVSGGRELSRLLELPLLVGIPHVRRGLSRRRLRLMSAIEDEAYATLAAAMDFAAPNGRHQRVILVGSALRGEGKTTVTAQLGRALARAGHHVLVVSGDLRIPRLHEHLGISDGVGFADILAALEVESYEEALDTVSEATCLVVPASQEGRPDGYLHAITSGTRPKDPARLLSAPVLRRFLRLVETLEYDYVLIDGPPLLGLADSQVMAQAVGESLIVCRLSSLRLENVIDLRDVLQRLETKPVGIVAIGIATQMSPYYEAVPDFGRESEVQR